ncbi:HA1F protein, partial [Piaya cayana]|nr:HA1F protein [Piaya cayana]
SLRYFDVAVTEPGPGLPEFVAAGYVDGTLVSRYDSDRRRMEPRAEWLNPDSDREHWDAQTETARQNQRVYRANLGAL